MRKAWLGPLLIATALVFQLTVLNGLRLPGGAVPDLVLVLVAALAMANGPVPGMITGFAAGLCLDLAPPGSQLVGQYALVFCLAGWAAGRLSRVAGRSPLLAMGLIAVSVAVTETLSAALGLVLQPAQVTIAQVRQLLPATIGYDLLICPFTLYLVMLAYGLRAGPLAGRLAAQNRAKSKPDRKREPRQPRLREAAARMGDGWIGGGPGVQRGAHSPARGGARLRPAKGVAGSASGLVHHRTRPATPVHLRLAAGRPRDGAIGNAVGTGLGMHWRSSRHPGLLARPSSKFRPHGGEPGGSAARQHGLGRPAGGAARRQPAINFGAHRGDASVGLTLGASWLTAAGRRSSPGPRLRMGASRSGVALAGHGGSAAAIPAARFRAGSARIVRRPAAVPKFRRTSGLLRPHALASGLVPGGVLDQSTFRAARRQRVGPPRLRLAGRGSPMLGGSGGSALRRPPGRSRRQPRFGYGKRSLLAFLTGRHIGGRWLASKRVGSRSGVWLLGSRTGGVR